MSRVQDIRARLAEVISEATGMTCTEFLPANKPAEGMTFLPGPRTDYSEDESGGRQQATHVYQVFTAARQVGGDDQERATSEVVDGRIEAIRTALETNPRIGIPALVLQARMTQVERDSGPDANNAFSSIAIITVEVVEQ